MIIQELNMIGFGKFSNRRIQFHQGMNLVYGLNESGKTTLFHFITAILYGFYKPNVKKRLLRDEYESYKPWSGGAYAGSLVFLDEKTQNLLRVERNFIQQFEYVKVFNHVTGEDLTASYDLNSVSRLPDIGLVHLGLSYTGFMNTLAVSQLGQETSKQLQGELNEALVNAMSARTVNISFTKLEAKLGQKIDEIGSSRKKTSKYAKEGQLYKDLEGQLKLAEQGQGMIEQLSKEIQVLQQKKTDLLVLKDQIKKDNLTTSLQQLRGQIDKVYSILNQKDQVLKLKEQIHLPRAYNEDDISVVIDQVKELELINQEIKLKQELLHMEEEKLLRLEEDKLFVLNEKKSIGKTLYGKGLNKVFVFLAFFLGAILCFALAILLSFVSGTIDFQEILLFLLTLVLGLGAIRYYSLMKAEGKPNSQRIETDKAGLWQEGDRSKDGKMKEDIAKDYEIQVQQVGQSIKTLAYQLSLLQEKKETLSADINHIKNLFSVTKLNELEVIRESYISLSDLTNRQVQLEIRCQDILGHRSLSDLEKERAKISDEFKARYTQGGPDYREPINGDHTQEELNEIIDKIESLNKDIMEKKVRRKEMLERYPKKASVLEKMESSKESIASMEFDQKVYSLIKESLDKIRTELQQNFAPILNQRVSTIIGHVTWDRYIDVKVNTDMEMLVEDPDSHTLQKASRLSRGSIDLFYLALRDALARWVSKDVNGPLILDESFAHFDDQRLTRIFDFYGQESRQVILFTCRQKDIDLAKKTKGHIQYL